MIALGDKIGRAKAHHLVENASKAAALSGRHLRDVLLETPEITAELADDRISALLVPDSYLGSAEAFVARAVDAYNNKTSREG